MLDNFGVEVDEVSLEVDRSQTFLHLHGYFLDQQNRIVGSYFRALDQQPSAFALPPWRMRL